MYFSRALHVTMFNNNIVFILNLALNFSNGVTTIVHKIYKYIYKIYFNQIMTLLQIIHLF